MPQENPTTTTTTTTTTMSGEVGSVKPNPYIFDIENRRKRKPRLAHDLGAGAKCNKCGDKCPGFELHFWRKKCMNCRCGKDDHDVEDDDEDIGKVVIGKLFDRPARTKKEELEFSYGNHLEMVNEETGKPEKVKFDWVPPNTERNLAARYMALLPPEKRPVAGSEAAKQRRKQLEQQLPLYDMDASQRCENMPSEELQSFEAYLERIKTQVAGQGIVQEIVGMPTVSVAQLLKIHPQRDSQLNNTAGNVAGLNYPASPIKNNAVYGGSSDTYAVPYRPVNQLTDHQYQQAGHQRHTRGLKDFMGGIIGEPGRHVAMSEPYGVAPGTYHPLQGLGQGQGMEGVTTQLSELNINENRQGLPSGESQQRPLEGHSYEVEGPHHHATGLGNAWSPQVSSTYGHNQIPTLQTPVSGKQGYLPGQEGLVPGKQGYVPGWESLVPGQQGLLPGQEGLVPGEQGYVPGKPALLSQEGFVPGKQGLLPGQEGFVPGKQDLLPGQEGFVPGRQGLLPGQEGFVPGKQGFLPGQEGFVPGKQGLLPGQEGFVPGKQGFLPGQEGFVPGKQDLLPGQEGFVPGKQGLLPGQEGFVPGKQGFLPGLEGFVPGRESFLPGQEGFVPGKQSSLPNLGGTQHQVPVIASEQALTPGRDTMIHRYHMGGSEPASTLPYQHAGVPDSSRTSEKLTSLSPSKEGGRVFLPQLSPRQGSVTDKEVIQAPYGTYMETLAGGIQVAPGTDVTVLFPDESQVLGSQARSGELPGQKSKFSCQYCDLPMNVGDVAIFCERAGRDKCWHPACFSCYTCKELLADLIYFYKDGKVYCGRHFTDAVDMPRCKACDELIFGNSWTRADDFDWHIHHYCCNICDTPLAGQRYVPDKGGLPHCLSCYMAYLSKMCQTCEEKIAPEENRCSHRGYFYHANAQCFQCYSCKIPLLGRKFKMSKNWLFCSNECIQAAAVDLANNPNPKEMPQ